MNSLQSFRKTSRGNTRGNKHFRFTEGLTFQCFAVFLLIAVLVSARKTFSELLPVNTTLCILLSPAFKCAKQIVNLLFVGKLWAHSTIANKYFGRLPNISKSDCQLNYVCPSVFLSAWNTPSSTGAICMKLRI